MTSRSVADPYTWLLLQCGEQDPSLFCTDRPRDGQPGTRNNEYISLFADQASVLQGRTALECYADFMYAFREAFLDDIGLAIHEVAIGGGPCGELRYPSYVETQGWRFPGVGVSYACSILHAKWAAYHPQYISNHEHEHVCILQCMFATYGLVLPVMTTPCCLLLCGGLPSKGVSFYDCVP